MEYRLLGPLEITARGTAVRIGGPKEQALLAVLLLHAGAPLSTDRLAEALWGDRQPRSAAVTIRGYIRSLRKALGATRSADSPELIHTTPFGYSLEVDPDRVDVRRFEELLRRARTAQSVGASRLAAALGTDALAQWRGEALHGLHDHTFARDEAVRLDGLKVGCQELVLDLRVQLGEHAAALEELRELVAAHPLRERALGALTLALYRSGQAAGAVAEFDAGRRRLRDELGVDPSPELQRLHQRILAHDPTLSLPPMAVGVPVVSAPSPVPAPLTSFVGRVDEIARVSAMCRERTVVTLTGIGGTGKTRLAIEIARRLAADFADGAVFCDLTAVQSGGAIDEVIAASVGWSRGSDVDLDRPIRARVLDMLSERHGLVVLDNCEHVIAPTAELVSDIVQRCPQVRVLATSREPLGLTGEVRVPLPPLSVSPPGPGLPADAVRLFMDRVADMDALAASPNAGGGVEALCAALDGIPLAIELAAAQVPFLSVRQISERLDDRLRLLHGGRGKIERHRTLAATMEWSYDLLAPDEQVFFRRLSVFPGSFTLDAAADVCGDALDTPPLALLGSLVRKSLVTRVATVEEDRYRLLETVLLFGRRRAAEALEHDGMRARHRDWYLAWVESLPTDEILDLGGGRVGFEAHNLRHALSWSRTAGEHAAAARLVSAMVGYYSMGTDLEEADELYSQQGDALLDPATTLRLVAGRAWIDLLVRPTQALESARAAAALAVGLTGTWAALANGIACVTSAFANRLDPQQTLHEQIGAYERRALDLADDPVVRTYVLHLVADARLFADDLPGAITLLEEAMALPGHPRERLASVVPNLLEAYHLAGRQRDADRMIDALSDAHAEVGPARAPRLAAATALTHAAAHRRTEAMTLLRHASSEASPLPGVLGQVLITLAAVAALADDWERASTLLAVVAVRSRRGRPIGRSGADVAVYRHYARLVRARMDGDTAARCRAEGAGLTVAEALDIGLATHT